MPLGPLMTARRAVLGERAGGPPRFLVRVDEFPHYRAWDDPGRFGTDRFARFHEIMGRAGGPARRAVLPRVSHEPLTPVGGARKRDAPRVRVGQANRDPPTPIMGVGLDHDLPPEMEGGLEHDSRPLEDGERAMLAQLVREGVSLALHGLTHRTRFSSPRCHSELCG